MVRIIDGDLLFTDTPIIAHQVNCLGAFNSGVAKVIRDYDHAVYDDYFKWCMTHTPMELLGTIKISDSEISDRKFVHLFGQYGYGRGKCFTDIKALSKCFYSLKELADGMKSPIAMPYRIGCGRGGGNWNEVSSLIEEIFKDNEIRLYRL